MTKHQKREALEQENISISGRIRRPAASGNNRRSTSTPAAVDVVVGLSVQSLDVRSSYLPMPCTELSNGLSSALRCRAAIDRAWRRPRHFCFADCISCRSQMFATLCSVGKGRDYGFADLDKSRARSFDAGALAAYASAFEKQRQGVGEQIGLRDPRLTAEPRQAVALRGLECLDDAPRRMIAIGQFDRRIDHIAATAVADRALGTASNPGMKLRERITGISGFKSVPYRLGLPGNLVKAGDHEIVLRAEVAIQRHLVGSRHVRDGVDTDPSDPMLAKEIPGRADDALPRLWRSGDEILHDPSST
jgi:hypothetical protein